MVAYVFEAPGDDPNLRKVRHIIPKEGADMSEPPVVVPGHRTLTRKRSPATSPGGIAPLSPGSVETTQTTVSTCLTAWQVFRSHVCVLESLVESVSGSKPTKGAQPSFDLHR